ncbi:MAG TPA: DUF3592 domain-containing protein [Actinospica sp.]|jgi:hypothetical protein|nr:DUF3592 domain-containing protein [Actinospica sp.]
MVRTTSTDTPRRTAGLIAHAGSALVVGAAVVGACARWEGPLWHEAARLVVIGAAVSLLGGLVRIKLGPNRGELAESLLLSAVVWMMAVLFAVGVGKLIYVHGLDDRATETVTATLTGCVADGDDSPRCFYHWTADGRARTQQDRADRIWPDGHQVRIRIDPARPDDPAVVSPGYWAWGFLIGLGALGTLGGAAMIVAHEHGDDD